MNSIEKIKDILQVIADDIGSHAYDIEQELNKLPSTMPDNKTLDKLKRNVTSYYATAFTVYKKWQDERRKMINEIHSAGVAVHEGARKIAGIDYERAYAQGQMNALGNVAYMLGYHFEWNNDIQQHELKEMGCEDD